MIIKIVVTLVGAILFLFLFWRRLREDYEKEPIFTTAFYILFGIAIGFVLAIYFFPSWWYWACFLGSGAGLSLGVIRHKLRVFEVVEAFVFAGLPLFGLVMFYDWARNTNVRSGAGFVIILALFFLFLFFDKHYRNFAWYKSGRIGFSGLTVLGLFFLVRAAIAATSFDVLSLVGKSDAILSGIFAFASFLAVFNLARRQI